MKPIFFNCFISVVGMIAAFGRPTQASHLHVRIHTKAGYNTEPCSAEEQTEADDYFKQYDTAGCFLNDCTETCSQNYMFLAVYLPNCVSGGKNLLEDATANYRTCDASTPK